MDENLRHTSISDVKIAVNDILKRITDMKIYGHEIYQGYITPCLFTDIRLNSETQETAYTALKNYRIYIQLMQDAESYDEELGYTILDRMKIEMLKNDPTHSHYILNIGERKVLVTDLSFNFIGNNSDIFEISYTVQFVDNTELEVTGDYDTINDIEIEYEMEDK